MGRLIPEQYLLTAVAIIAIIAIVIMSKGTALSVPSASALGKATMTGQFIGIGNKIGESLTGYSIGMSESTKQAIAKANNYKTSIQTYRNQINAKTIPTGKIKKPMADTAMKQFSDSKGVITPGNSDSIIRYKVLFSKQMKGYGLLNGPSNTVPDFSQRFSGLHPDMVYAYCFVNPDQFQKNSRGCYILAAAYGDAGYGTYQELANAARKAGIDNKQIDCMHPPWKNLAACH